MNILTNKMKQTSVEWLEDCFDRYGALLKSDFIKAKEMEKQQIVEFAENYELYESDKHPRKTFEQYYNETYKNK